MIEERKDIGDIEKSPQTYFCKLKMIEKDFKLDSRRLEVTLF